MPWGGLVRTHTPLGPTSPTSGVCKEVGQYELLHRKTGRQPDGDKKMNILKHKCYVSRVLDDNKGNTSPQSSSYNFDPISGVEGNV